MTSGTPLGRPHNRRRPRSWGRFIGVVVDGVSDVHTLDTKSLQQAPDMNGVISGEFVKGLATIEESMIIVLNVDYLVSIGILDEIKKSLTTEK